MRVMPPVDAWRCTTGQCSVWQQGGSRTLVLLADCPGMAWSGSRNRGSSSTGCPWPPLQRELVGPEAFPAAGGIVGGAVAGMSWPELFAGRCAGGSVGE